MDIESLEEQIAKGLYYFKVGRNNWELLRTSDRAGYLERAKAILDLGDPPLREILQKHSEGKLVEPESIVPQVIERVVGFIESYLVTTVHLEGNMHHIDDAEWLSVKSRALKIKPMLECKGINCEQYNHRCVAYGEPASDCPLRVRLASSE